MDKKRVEKFNEQGANKLSDRLKKKIIELQESVEVIDELSNAKKLFLELNSTNEAIKKHINLNQSEFEGEKAKLKGIKEKVETEQALADQTLDEIKSSNADAVKTENDSAKNRLAEIRNKVKEAEKASVDAIREAGKRANEAEELADDAVRRKEEAEAKYDDLKVTMFK